MPWLSLPFSRRDEKAALSRRFGVSGIPALITLAPDGTIINKAARAAVTDDPTGLSCMLPIYCWCAQQLPCHVTLRLNSGIGV